MDGIPSQIFKSILSIFQKTMEKILINSISSVQIYVNKIENRITFKTKLLIPETMKLLGSIENKTTKDKNGENVPHLEITEVVLVHFNIANNDY